MVHRRELNNASLIQTLYKMKFPDKEKYRYYVKTAMLHMEDMVIAHTILPVLNFYIHPCYKYNNHTYTYDTNRVSKICRYI